MKYNEKMERDLDYCRKTIKELFDGNENTENYVYHYMIYAAKEVRKAKRRYYVLSFITVACPALIIALERMDPRPMNWMDYVTLLLNLCSTLAASTLALFRIHGRWLHFRSYLEQGKQLLAEYMSNPEEMDIIAEFQKLNSKERKQWNALYKTENKDD